MTTGDLSAGEMLREGTGGTGVAPLASPTVVRRRRYFVRHLLGYALVNVALVAVWVVVGATSGSWFFWPVFVLASWGLVLDVHAWWAYGPSTRTGSTAVPHHDR
jgi:hypothetical protein